MVTGVSRHVPIFMVSAQESSVESRELRKLACPGFRTSGDRSMRRQRTYACIRTSADPKTRKPINTASFDISQHIKPSALDVYKPRRPWS